MFQAPVESVSWPVIHRVTSAHTPQLSARQRRAAAKAGEAWDPVLLRTKGDSNAKADKFYHDAMG